MFNTKLGKQFLIFLVLSMLLSSCNVVQGRQLDAKTREIQKNLYVPQDAALLDQFSQVGPKKYVASNCIVAYLETAYGVSRPLTSIIEEYYDRLTQDGWELNPHYALRRTDEDVYLRKGSQLELVIYSYTDSGRAPSTKLPPEASRYTTAYVVALTYSEPLSLECSV